MPEPSPWSAFGLFLTFGLGAAAAFQSGRALAQTWRPWWQVVPYMLLLAAAVRFLHHALNDEPLLVARLYLVEAAVCLAFGLLGFRMRRTAQMTTQYRWLYERTSPVSWRERPAPQPPVS